MPKMRSILDRKTASPHCEAVTVVRTWSANENGAPETIRPVIFVQRTANRSR